MCNNWTNYKTFFVCKSNIKQKQRVLENMQLWFIFYLGWYYKPTEECGSTQTVKQGWQARTYVFYIETSGCAPSI